MDIMSHPKISILLLYCTSYGKLICLNFNTLIYFDFLVIPQSKIPLQ